MFDETQTLIAAVAEAAHESVSAVMSRDRRRPLPVCRYMVAASLMKFGYNSQTAAKELGLTHATLWHGRNILDRIEDEGWSRTHGYAMEYGILVRYRALTDGQKV